MSRAKGRLLQGWKHPRRQILSFVVCLKQAWYLGYQELKEICFLWGKWNKNPLGTLVVLPSSLYLLHLQSKGFCFPRLPCPPSLHSCRHISDVIVIWPWFENHGEILWLTLSLPPPPPFFWPCHRILLSQPSIKTVLPAVEVWSPNHWTVREFPPPSFLIWTSLRSQWGHSFSRELSKLTPHPYLKAPLLGNWSHQVLWPSGKHRVS